ncbi:hypothetical protein RI844_14655 [Thalassotalea fonticola]|uniref:Peptidase M1 membrane alanine aminopeptidase domain-containing protein n=1 Tax=Thalassotalea fonticola TaxID=3065649 RepID=A0ABZ0GL35_9GAMM|nr:hypothetical protein RI844_14655 [Colwelliaceae bacterium S1-1]
MKILLKKCLSALMLLSSVAVIPAKASEQQINMINDVSHHYSFFYAWKNPNSFGGKYGYVDWNNNQQFIQSQATISTINLTDINLFNVLLGANQDLLYTAKDVAHLNKYLTAGGGLFLVNTAIMQESPNARALLQEYGVAIAKEMSNGRIFSADGEEYEISKQVNLLALDDKYEWEVLAADESDNPVIATREQGKGHVTVSSFSPFKRIQTKGKQLADDFRFPNYELMQPIFKQTASGKTVKKEINLDSIPTDKVKDMGSFQIRYTDYSAHIVEKVLKDYNVIYPELEKYMGVPMAAGHGEGEIFAIDLLATGGGGVSYGKRIGISMFKDNYFGILGHELTHSWVLPHGEPLSGEGIAIHVGSKTQALASKKIGYEKGVKIGSTTLTNRISKAVKAEGFKQWDPINMSAKEGISFGKTITHGKYLYIIDHFETTYGEDVVARYFQLKRKLVPATEFNFTGHDSVWLWSKATGEDQFTYFQKLGIAADKAKVAIPAALAES